MRKGTFVTTVILVLAWIVFVVGVILFFYGMAKDEGEAVASGLAMMISLIFNYGFCYIVKAACRYLELHQNDK